MHAHGPGLAALLGRAEETQQLVDDYDEFVHADDRPDFDVNWRFADLIRRDGAVVEQEYRLVGVDGVARWVRDRAAIRVVEGRVLLTGAVRDISAQRHAEDERAEALRRLEWLSRVDALTELFNRRHFSEVLRARLAGSAAGAAIALVDVDHFKRINDTQGHQIGDLVLREIARRLQDATRPCDVTSRWGGEEFCVLLDEIGDDEELETVVERLRAAVAASPIAIGANGAVEITISIGAVRPSATCHTPEQLLASADAALYAAKRGGRNQAQIAQGAPLLVPVDASEGLEGVVQALAAAASVRGGVARCTPRGSQPCPQPSRSSWTSRPRTSSLRASAAGCTTAARSRCLPTSSLDAVRSTTRRVTASATTPPPARRSSASCPV